MRGMSACEFLGSNIDFYAPLVLKRADLFLAADLFLECLVLYQEIHSLHIPYVYSTVIKK